MSGFQIPGLTTLSGTASTIALQSSSTSPSSVPHIEKPSPVPSQGNIPLQAAKEVAINTAISQDKMPDPSNFGNQLDSGQDDMALDQETNDPTSRDQNATTCHMSPSPPSLTSGLEAMLGGLDPSPSQPDAQPSASISPIMDGDGISPRDDDPIAGPEWEEDSSPYESSSESSTSSDSDEDSEDEKGYQIMGAEETARILMEMDVGSDEECEGKGKGNGSSMVRTKNELPEDIIPRPQVEITPEMEMVQLGSIEHVVANMIVIRANVSGEYEVLDTGSVLCLRDRTVIAAVADIIATVREPRYTAGFATEDEIKSLGLEVGTKIYYPPKLAKLGLTQALRVDKGTDASNWHDEEVGDDEMEFSDDEKEAEFKRQQKAKKRGARGGRDGAAANGGRTDATYGPFSAGPPSLRYEDDEEDEDGPYRPLARPAGFGQGQAPHAGTESTVGGYRGGRGDFRGRATRGRGGRGGHRGKRSQAQQNFAQARLPPQYNPPPFTSSVSTNATQAFPTFPFQTNGKLPPPPPLQQPSNHQFPFAWPTAAQPGSFPPPPPQFTGQQNVNGMYLNPNVLAALQQLQAYQNQGQGTQSQGQSSNSQWPRQGGRG
ncbi:NAF1-domain-containing protein [Xylariaceae sp. FL1272]|nr:NAF1-domain-containing protein [Xylariaceae sp. FL1272]